MKTTKLCFAALFLGLVNAAFAQQLPATMEEGQQDTFSLGGRIYAIEILLIYEESQTYVILKVNDQRINPLT